MIKEWLSVLGVKQHTEEVDDDVDTKVFNFIKLLKKKILCKTL